MKRTTPASKTVSAKRARALAGYQVKTMCAAEGYLQAAATELSALDGFESKRQSLLHEAEGLARTRRSLCRCHDFEFVDLTAV